MAELVSDKNYREFLETVPYLPPIMANKKMALSPPWVVFVQRESGGKWGKKEFWKYSKAFKFMRAWMKQGAYDVTINNKRFAYEPPTRVVRVKGQYKVGSDGVRRQVTKPIPWKIPAALAVDQPDHTWCMYCRRPTLFKYYSRHHYRGVVDSTVSRCNICGASSRVAISKKSR